MQGICHIVAILLQHHMRLDTGISRSASGWDLVRSAWLNPQSDFQTKWSLGLQWQAPPICQIDRLLEQTVEAHLLCIDYEMH